LSPHIVAHYFYINNSLVLIECFKQFDKNGDGKINVEELPAALNFVGVHPTEEDTKDILRLLDKQGEHLLSILRLVNFDKVELFSLCF